MNKNWHGLVKIVELWQTDSLGNIVYRAENLYNVFHLKGEEYMLDVCFSGGTIPSNYYFGLDDRAILYTSDTMLTTSASEPTTNGYGRVAVAADSFSVSLESGRYKALGPIVSFSATGGSWGPVRNLFMATAADNNGVLIASVPLNQSITLTAGGTVNMRLKLSLGDCS